MPTFRHPHKSHVEAGHIVGTRAGILFIDLQKCHDSVDLVLLVKACIVLEYPWIPLLFLVQPFLGPRTLRADGQRSDQIPVSNGFVSGSSQANHLARALLHRALHDHHHRSPFSQPAVELFHCLGKLKVDLSPSKYGFVATTRGTALTVCSGWCKRFGCGCLLW